MKGSYKNNFFYGPPEEVEKRRMLEAINSTSTESFNMLMKLIKVSTMIQNARIISKPEAK
jgi:hypothetical protein